MKKTLFALFASLLLVATVYASNTPIDVIRQGSNKMLSIIKQENGTNTKQVRQQMEDTAAQLFDFQRMTALAVGRGWREANPEQQTSLVHEFRNLLIRTYAGTMLRFKHASIDVKTDQTDKLANGRESTVNSVVTPDSGKDSVTVDYMMYKGSNGWKIYNVSVEGASLVTVYRNQFNETINQSGVDGLIKALKDKNSTGNSN